MVWPLFVLWTVGVIAGISALTRASCELDAKSRQTLSTVTAAVGWRVRYWLPAGHPGTATIATQLAKRGPLAGVMEEICLIGDAGRLATRMRAAGWTVTSATGDAEPRMEIFSPDRTLRWSGPFRGFDDAGANDTLMLDIVVLEKVARGEAVAPFVPAGCVTPLPRESTAARGPG